MTHSNNKSRFDEVEVKVDTKFLEEKELQKNIEQEAEVVVQKEIEKEAKPVNKAEKKSKTYIWGIFKPDVNELLEVPDELICAFSDKDEADDYIQSMSPVIYYKSIVELK